MNANQGFCVIVFVLGWMWLSIVTLALGNLGFYCNRDLMLYLYLDFTPWFFMVWGSARAYVDEEALLG